MFAEKTESIDENSSNFFNDMTMEEQIGLARSVSGGGFIWDGGVSSLPHGGLHPHSHPDPHHIHLP